MSREKVLGQADDFLQVVVDSVNKGDEEAHVTLLVGGFLVSGTLISETEYFERVGDQCALAFEDCEARAEIQECFASFGARQRHSESSNMEREDRLAEHWERKHAEYSHRLGRLLGTLSEHRYAEEHYLTTGTRVLELAKRAHSLYIDQDRDEQRKLVDLMASNCSYKDGKAHVELKEVFAILVDGVAREEEMQAAGATKEAIEKKWLPG